MRYFPVLIFSLLVPVAAQQPPCAVLPTKPPVPVGSTTKSPSQVAIAAIANSAEMAAKKLQFEQQMAKLDADPNVQAQRTKHLQMLSAAAQNSDSFQNQKAKFQADLKCTGQ